MSPSGSLHTFAFTIREDGPNWGSSASTPSMRRRGPPRSLLDRLLGGLGETIGETP
jgi:hypothetical protein